MQRRPLGATGVEVPVLSFGTAPLGGLFGAIDDADALRLVHEAIDLGMTFIDTSPYYGSAEERLGRALGLLTPGGPGMTSADHPATAAIHAAADAMRAACAEAGVDLSFLANQYSIQRTAAATTLVGTRSSAHLRAAVATASTPVDEELLSAVLALRPPDGERTWPSGRPEKN